MPIDAHLQRAQGALTTLSNGRHVWSADVNQTLGGTDRAPDPHELLDSALAACTLLTLELYIRRKQLAVTDLHVRMAHHETKDAQGVVHYQLTRQLQVTGDLTEPERQRLLEMASKCPIHRVLEGEIHIATEWAAA